MAVASGQPLPSSAPGPSVVRGPDVSSIRGASSVDAPSLASDAGSSRACGSDGELEDEEGGEVEDSVEPSEDKVRSKWAEVAACVRSLRPHVFSEPVLASSDTGLGLQACLLGSPASLCLC